MYRINYDDRTKRLKQRYCGIDIATGQGQDYTALCLIDRYEVKKIVGDFPTEIKNEERFEIVHLERTRDLNLDMQVKWLTNLIESLDAKPVISVDATRELGTTVSLRDHLPGYGINKIIWSGGSAITREGRKYVVSKVQALMDLKSMVSLGRLTIPPEVSLRDELVKELQGFTFEESASGGFTIKSGSQHDDLAMALCACVVPLLERRILERAEAQAIQNPFNFNRMANR
jgi:hypothetical protein